jgi:adenylate kinase
MFKIIVLMGAPGAGKGTQARLLQERLNLPQISTGDIFRALDTVETPLARQVKEIMDRGQLVPDDLTIRLVKERTSKDDCRNGYILDGFPRTPAQADSLEELAAEQQNRIVAILIDVPSSFLEERMTARRKCPVCDEIYNLETRPPKNDNFCDFHPTVQLVKRADDNVETVRARIATFEEQTRPLIDYYQAAGLLRTVDGTRTPEAIFDDIEKIVRD